MSASALTMDRKTDQLGTPDAVLPQLLYFPVEANTSIYGGALVATNAAGNAVPATAVEALIVWGRCERQVLNTTAAGFGSAGAVSVTVRSGVFFFNNSTIAAISAADVGLACYAENDNVVSATSQGGTLPFAGTIVAYSTPAGDSLQVGVLCGIAMANAQQPTELVHATIDIPLTTIQGKTSTTPFNIGSVLPTNCQLLSTELNVIQTVTGGSISACHVTVANTSAAAGEIMASSDVFTATGLQNHVGSNPYQTRGGQQLQAILTTVGDTLANATAGHLAVSLFYAVLA